MSPKQRFSSLGLSDDNLLTSICRHPQHLRSSKCKSDHVTTWVFPPDRELYHQKIMIPFPVASLILSSCKQPWEAWRRRTKKNKTEHRLLQIIPKCCNADTTVHGTSGWDIFVFSFLLTCTSNRPHKCKIYWWDCAGRAAGSVQPVSAGSLASLFFLCCIMLVWVR